MGTITPRGLTLVQAENIAANNYLSKDQSKDYDVESINALIWSRQASRSAKANDALIKTSPIVDDTLPPPIPFEADEGLEDIIMPHNAPAPTPDHSFHFQVVTGPTVAPEPMVVPSPNPPQGTAWAEFKAMPSRYDGRCKETGDSFYQGDWILWNSENRSVYRAGSDTFKNYTRFLILLVQAKGG